MKPLLWEKKRKFSKKQKKRFFLILLVILVSKDKNLNLITYLKDTLNDLWKYSNGSWTWISGNNTIDAPGVYGTKGIPSTSNHPGAREAMGFLIDSSDSIWMFGGLGYDSFSIGSRK